LAEHKFLSALPRPPAGPHATEGIQDAQGNRKRLEIIQFEVNGVSCGMSSAAVLGRASWSSRRAKNSFKERPQLVLVLFIGGQFAESHPLLLICQIGQISCGICKLLISLMMTSVCTFRSKRRRAFSNDS
jgi:hypothetical protein